jgi:hypothetical protein
MAWLLSTGCQLKSGLVWQSGCGAPFLRQGQADAGLPRPLKVNVIRYGSCKKNILGAACYVRCITLIVVDRMLEQGPRSGISDALRAFDSHIVYSALSRAR